MIFLLKSFAIGGEKNHCKMENILTNKYNALQIPEIEVLSLATGRERLLEVMLSEMEVCLKKGSNQHFLIHGPRGIGKSFFTRYLKIHHGKSKNFNNTLFIQLPEQQENVNYVSDLLDVIATALEGGRPSDTAPRWAIADHQWQLSKQRLNAALEVVDKKGIEHVFVTQENLQSFIPKLDKIESSRLREFLSSYEKITLIGTSLRPDLDNDYSKRLFQVFKKIELEPWSENDFLSYYDKLVAYKNYDQLKIETIKKSKTKIRAISKFTGGSPRLAVILNKLVLENDFLEPTKLLESIIDELTPYYQELTNNIPGKSKILFDMLIRKGENMTQSALATAFEPALDQSTIARSFAWLTDNFYVVYQKQNKGNTKYFYVQDRLYVIYYQKSKIYTDKSYSYADVFVNFLKEYYTQKDIILNIEKSNLVKEDIVPYGSFPESHAYHEIRHCKKEHRFSIFKKIISEIKQTEQNQIIKFINSICIGLYTDNDFEFLQHIVDELSYEFKDDPFVMVNLEVFKYLLEPAAVDINGLHPDVRIVVNSILNEK